ncbi:hypothetical protein [Pseudomonas grimontii]|uniref:hypothetical protein n=1 Tax=Pseudomonas grimontii TaxID=129847 RepID=UPI00387B347C
MPRVTTPNQIPSSQPVRPGCDDAGPAANRSIFIKVKGFFRKGHAVSPSQKASPPTQTVFVDTGRFKTVKDNTSMLSAQYLSSCSALAVLSGWNGSTYKSRTLMHLNGGSLPYGLIDQGVPELLAELKGSLAGGGKVIWVGGVDAQTDFQLALSLKQEKGGLHPLRDLLETPGICTVIAGSSGIDIKPDGTFKLAPVGRGELTERDVQQMRQFM